MKIFAGVLAGLLCTHAWSGPLDVCRHLEFAELASKTTPKLIAEVCAHRVVIGTNKADLFAAEGDARFNFLMRGIEPGAELRALEANKQSDQFRELIRACKAEITRVTEVLEGRTGGANALKSSTCEIESAPLSPRQ